jgi:hypothetical protein
MLSDESHKMDKAVKPEAKRFNVDDDVYFLGGTADVRYRVTNAPGPSGLWTVKEVNLDNQRTIGTEYFAAGHTLALCVDLSGEAESTAASSLGKRNRRSTSGKIDRFDPTKSLGLPQSSSKKQLKLAPKQWPQGVQWVFVLKSYWWPVEIKAPSSGVRPCSKPEVRYFLEDGLSPNPIKDTTYRELIHKNFDCTIPEGRTEAMIKSLVDVHPIQVDDGSGCGPADLRGALTHAFKYVTQQQQHHQHHQQQHHQQQQQPQKKQQKKKQQQQQKPQKQQQQQQQQKQPQKQPPQQQDQLRDQDQLLDSTIGTGAIMAAACITKQPQSMVDATVDVEAGTGAQQNLQNGERFDGKERRGASQEDGRDGRADGGLQTWKRKKAKKTKKGNKVVGSNELNKEDQQKRLKVPAAVGLDVNAHDEYEYEDVFVEEGHEEEADFGSGGAVVDASAAWIGRRVRRLFYEESKYFNGSIRGHKGGYWQVVYDDGDEEDYTRKEVKKVHWLLQTPFVLQFL